MNAPSTRWTDEQSAALLAASNAQAVAWVVDAVLDGEVDRTASFFDLPGDAQFLALQVLRTATRSAVVLGPLDGPTFMAGVCGKWNQWILAQPVTSPGR